MRFFHGRAAARTRLLAAGVLEGGERRAAELHLSSCAECQAELAETAALLAALEADLPPAEPPIGLAALQARVLARLDQPRAAWAASRWPALTATLAAAGVTVVLLTPPPPPPPPAVPVAAPSTAPAAGDALLVRLERQLAREQTARYLSEAQDVLVAVSALASPCPRGRGRVDVGAESRKSRELLARGRLVVPREERELAAATPVLEDVETMLREVARLSSCARQGEVDALSREMSRRRLFMKIDLMARELVG